MLACFTKCSRRRMLPAARAVSGCLSIHCHVRSTQKPPLNRPVAGGTAVTGPKHPPHGNHNQEQGRWVGKENMANACLKRHATAAVEHKKVATRHRCSPKKTPSCQLITKICRARSTLEPHFTLLGHFPNHCTATLQKPCFLQPTACRE